MRNARLEETQAGIKIAWRNINNLRYAGDTTLMAESEEELKSFLMNVKEESEKVGLKLPITSWQIGSEGKASAYNAGDLGSVPGLGRSPGEGNGNPLQYSCLENPMDGGAW